MCLCLQTSQIVKIDPEAATHAMGLSLNDSERTRGYRDILGSTCGPSCKDDRRRCQEFTQQPARWHCKYHEWCSCHIKTRASVALIWINHGVLRCSQLQDRLVCVFQKLLICWRFSHATTENRTENGAKMPRWCWRSEKNGRTGWRRYRLWNTSNLEEAANHTRCLSSQLSQGNWGYGEHRFIEMKH